MDNILSILIGAPFIIFGIILLTRKKLFINNKYINIFYPFVLISSLYSNTSNFWLGVLIILFLIIFGVVVGRNRYLITNVNKKIVSNELTNILKEKQIRYKEEKRSIYLLDYEKSIYIFESLNTVDINIKQIKELPFYEEIKHSFKNNIQQNNRNLFPSAGVFTIFMGLIVIIIM